jgi:hypothetical protein
MSPFGEKKRTKSKHRGGGNPLTGIRYPKYGCLKRMLALSRWGEGWNQGKLGVGGVGVGLMMDIFE